MSQAWCRAISGGIRLSLQIQPNAKRSGVAGCFADLLKIRLHAQPIEGKANDALISYLSDVLDVPKNAVSIARGHTAKRKIVEIKDDHLTVEVVVQKLLGPDNP